MSPRKSPGQYPTKEEIITYLMEEERSPKDLACQFDFTTSAGWNWLRLLEREGIAVQAGKKCRSRLFRFVPEEDRKGVPKDVEVVGKVRVIRLTDRPSLNIGTYPSTCRPKYVTMGGKL